MKKPIPIAATIAALFALSALASAGGRHAFEHDSAFPFLFGNEIDGHQRSRLQNDGDLFGFFYVHFTGVTTKDGQRVATHADCHAAECSVGWLMFGRPRSATFLYHQERDHPVYLLPRVELPQPGAYSHFHPTGADPHASGPGYVLALTAIDSFCFIHEGADQAIADKTCAENGGVPVSPGIDVATHLNIVTSFPGAATTM